MSARLSTVVERAFSAASEKASDTFRRTYDRFLRFTGLGSFGRQTPLIAIGMALGGLAGLIAAGVSGGMTPRDAYAALLQDAPHEPGYGHLITG